MHLNNYIPIYSSQNRESTIINIMAAVLPCSYSDGWCQMKPISSFIWIFHVSLKTKLRNFFKCGFYCIFYFVLKVYIYSMTRWDIYLENSHFENPKIPYNTKVMEEVVSMEKSIVKKILLGPDQIIWGNWSFTMKLCVSVLLGEPFWADWSREEIFFREVCMFTKFSRWIIYW